MMNDEQRRLFNLLVRLDKFLKKHDIEYYIDGGTLIGAIRNRGFLPWDDDVDTVMTRANYEKLLAVADELHDEGLDLACYERYNDYTKHSVKVIDLSTTMILYGDIVHRHSCGTQVDIFIFDPLPANKVNEYTKYFSVYTELLTYNYLDNEKVVKYIPTYKKYKFLMHFLGRDRVLKMLRDKLFCYTEEESDYFILRYHEPDLFYDKGILQRPKYAEFEGYTFPIPTRSEDFLRTMYDDSWAIVPQISEQLPHNDIRDLNVSGNNYYDDLYKFLDLKKANRTFNLRKRYSISRLPSKLGKDKYEARFAVLSAECQLKDTIDVENINKLFEEKKYWEICDIIEPIVNYRRHLIKGDILPEFSSDFYVKSLYSLICCGKYYRADIICGIAKRYFNNDDFDDIAMLIKICRDLAIALDNKRYSDAENIVNKYFEKYSDVVDFIKAKIIVELQNNNSKQLYDNKIINMGLKLHNRDGELLKLYGDIIKDVFGKDKAMDYYREAVNNTRNGLVWLELKEKYGLQPEVL